MVGNRIGPYQLIRLIEEDQFGEIFEALDRASTKRVAIRALRAGAASLSETAPRLYSEAKTLARLHHPHIARTYGFIRNAGSFYLVLERVEGETLQSLLKVKRRLELPVALAYFRQILSAVTFAHSLGVVHGDLKASNIVVTDFGRIKILDFAIALLLRGKAGQAAERGAAQPDAAGANPVAAPDEQADIYSLGALMHECLAGCRPIVLDECPTRPGSTPLPLSLLIENCPPWLDAFVLSALQPQSHDRFATVAAMAQAMDAAVDAGAKPHARGRLSGSPSPGGARGGPAHASGMRRARNAGSLLCRTALLDPIRRGTAVVVAWRRFCRYRRLDRAMLRLNELKSYALTGSALAQRGGQGLRARCAATKRTIVDPCRAQAKNFIARLRTAPGPLRGRFPARPFLPACRHRLTGTGASILLKASSRLRSGFDAAAKSDWRKFAAIAIVAASATIEIFVFRGANTILLSDGHDPAALTRHGAAESFIEPLGRPDERAEPSRKQRAPDQVARPQRNSAANERPAARAAPSRDAEHHRARVARRVVTYRVDPTERRSSETKTSEPPPPQSKESSKLQLSVKWEN